jgi:hypothetical protein
MVCGIRTQVQLHHARVLLPVLYIHHSILHALHGTCVLLPCTYYLHVHGSTAYTESGVMVHLSLQRIYTYTCQLPHEVVCTDTPQDVIPAGDAIQHLVLHTTHRMYYRMYVA